MDEEKTHNPEPTIEELQEKFGLSVEGLARMVVSRLTKKQLARLICEEMGDSITAVFAKYPFLQERRGSRGGAADPESSVLKIVVNRDYFEDFKVEDTLFGGTGEVYVARYDPEHAWESGAAETEIERLKNKFGGSRLAVKVLLEIQEHADITRFEREMDTNRELSEAGLAATVDPRKGKTSGGIMPILHEGITVETSGSRQPYYVMPLLHKIEKDRLDERDALVLIYNVAGIIARVHELGYLHRDLKPENILLVEKNAYHKPVVGDFGLVKDVFKSFDTFKTMSRSVMGTPFYMSPEQTRSELGQTLKRLENLQDKKRMLLLGDRYHELTESIAVERNRHRRHELRKMLYQAMERREKEIRAGAPDGKMAEQLNEIQENIAREHRLACKSDLYSLGAMLFKWVTGKKPTYDLDGEVAGHDVTNRSEMIQLLYAAQSKTSDLSFLPHEVGVSDELSTVILGAMEKEPSDRYETVEDFIRDLELCMNGQTPALLAENPEYLNQRMIRKSGVEFLFQKRLYSKGREKIDRELGRWRKRKQKDTGICAERMVEKWDEAQSSFRKKLGRNLADLRDTLGSCSTRKFADHVGELTNLLRELKIVPAEDRMESGFPTVTDSDGRWLRSDTVAACKGYWVDVLDMLQMDHEVVSRIAVFLEKDYKEVGSEELYSIYLVFGKEYERRPSRRVQKKLLQIARRHPEPAVGGGKRFMPAFDRLSLARAGFEENEFVLSTDNLFIVNALFHMNRHSMDNRFQKTASEHLDCVIENLLRPDGSVFRNAVFDENGKLKKKLVDGIELYETYGPGGFTPNDRFAGDANVCPLTSSHEQASLITALASTYRYTRKKKYRELLDKSLGFFLGELSDEMLAPRYMNAEDRKKEYALGPTVLVAPALIDLARCTGEKAYRETAVRLLQAVVRRYLDVSHDTECVLSDPAGAEPGSSGGYVLFDWAFLLALSRLVEKDVPRRRLIKSTPFEGEKPPWENSHFQCGFTRLDGSIAPDQCELRVMHDESRLVFRLRGAGDMKNDFYSLLIGEKNYTTKTGPGVKILTVPFEKLGILLSDRRTEIKMNIMRNRRNPSTGARTTVSSWSENPADLFIEDGKAVSYSKDRLMPSYGVLLVE